MPHPINAAAASRPEKANDAELKAGDALRATDIHAFASLRADAGAADRSTRRASRAPRAWSTPSPSQAQVVRTGGAVLRRLGIEGLPPEPT